MDFGSDSEVQPSSAQHDHFSHPKVSHKVNRRDIYIPSMLFQYFRGPLKDITIKQLREDDMAVRLESSMYQYFRQYSRYSAFYV